MGRVKVKAFGLHTPLNIAGKNFKSSSATSLIEVTPDMDVTYDDDNKRLFIYYKNVLRIVDNVDTWEPVDYEKYGYEAQKPKQPIGLGINVSSKPIRAQVETPHEKVQNPPTHRSVR
jgi:hypothetical protein